ncbi:hypothetical protein TASIC1_0012014000 [Trichoderma asperellum]|uniref:DUF7514 domain-containing protein n=1 Tax=Trichoderma asperellum TaxID=101201 RepID=A0A6V8R296_TRIAP|nr:hypothetical protein TASIC1_0012014000 [Trichoderma asperellum]
MATEATVLHGPLPSAADGSTTSPTPRGGDGKLDGRPLSHTAVSRQRQRRERKRDEDEDKEAFSDDAASVGSGRRTPSRRSSFPYRDIIKSVLSHVMTKNEVSTSSPSPSSPPSSSHGKDKSEMKDKKVEDVVRGLAMEEWNARWLDELVAKVKGELNDAASDHSVSDDCPPTPSSQSSDDDDDDASSLKDSMKRYQPTVEDYDEDEDSASEPESQDTAQDGTSQPLSRSSSLSSSSSTDSAMSSPSSQSSYSTTASSPPPAEPKDPRLSPRPTVHFSDKQPPVIHYITDPLEPEPEPELEREPEREPELYRTHSLPSHPRPPVVTERQTPAWGPLFNERDEPTPALGRFLRGLANYIIAEYSPTDSLVITPDKLFKFYTRYKLDNEFFPFQRVFDTRYHKSLRGLSFLFTDLRCEHHLVQESITAKPVIPSLTPTGFEDWMTLLIRAFPDREAKRLDMVLADIPLLADDNRHSSRSPVRASSSSSSSSGERPLLLLPRQLPRQLFPERGHARAFDLLASSFSEWNRITTTAPVPPPEVPPPHPLAYSLSSNIPASLQKLPPAASKALKEDTRRHKDACYIDQTRLRPSSIIYPSSASPTSPSSSSFSTSSSIPADVAKSHSEQQQQQQQQPSSTSGSSSSSSKHHHRTSRSKERDSRHRSSRPRERSPPPSSSGRRSHRSRRYRASSPSESVEQRYSSGRGDERRRERERRGSVVER